MWNIKSRWNNKQNDTEPISVPNCPTKTLKLRLQFYIPWASSSSGVNQHRSVAFSEAPHICSCWGSAPLLVASWCWYSGRAVAGTCCPAAGVCAHPAVLGTGCPQRAGEPLLRIAAQQPSFGLPPGRKLPSEWICFLLGLLATPSWDCRAEFSQNILIPFSVTLKCFSRWVELVVFPIKLKSLWITQSAMTSSENTSKSKILLSSFNLQDSPVSEVLLGAVF